MRLAELTSSAPSTPLICGVLNATPDSFSDGGKFAEPAAAIKRVRELTDSGAGVIDLGGESTRPGSQHVDLEDEWRRIAPILEACAKDTIFSIDTQKSEVAARALKHGAKIINDVSALRTDGRLASVVADNDAWLVLMYSAFSEIRPPAGAPVVTYSDVIGQICTFFRQKIQIAVSSGVNPDKIIVDPGLGAFVSKDPAYSWEILTGLSRFRELGIANPIMVGPSRKGFLGGKLSARDPLSQLASLMAFRNGANLVRIHNVEMAANLLKCRPDAVYKSK
jgi:dihydropteroate synthase